MKASITPLSSDADLTRRIGIAFATRPRIAKHTFQVSTHDGIVTLRGMLPTVYDRRLIVAVTRHVAGVFGIIDQLTVVDPATEKASQESLAGEPQQRGTLASPRVAPPQL